MLTPKQEKFCIEYAKLGNLRQANKNAGYKFGKNSTADVNACRLLKNDKIKKRLAELTKEIKNDSIADVQEMQQTLTEIIRQTLEEEVVVVEGRGEGCSEAKKLNKKPSTKDIINAINTLGKMQGAFVDKVEATINDAPKSEMAELLRQRKERIKNAPE